MGRNFTTFVSCYTFGSNQNKTWIKRKTQTFLNKGKLHWRRRDPYWDSKLNSIIFNTGIKESEFIRKATIKEIEQTISKVPK
jgi:hypothetical protein